MTTWISRSSTLASVRAYQTRRKSKSSVALRLTWHQKSWTKQSIVVPQQISGLWVSFFLQSCLDASLTEVQLTRSFTQRSLVLIISCPQRFTTRCQELLSTWFLLCSTQMRMHAQLRSKSWITLGSMGFLSLKSPFVKIWFRRLPSLSSSNSKERSPLSLQANLTRKLSLSMRKRQKQRIKVNKFVPRAAASM